jgi:hypothetical protein
MQEAAARPPQFLEVYEAVCVELRGQYGPDGVPDAGLINQLCVEHNLGYRIEGARLLLREGSCLSSGGKVQCVIIRHCDVTYAAFFTCSMSWYPTSARSFTCPVRSRPNSSSRTAS